MLGFWPEGIKTANEEVYLIDTVMAIEEVGQFAANLRIAGLDMPLDWPTDFRSDEVARLAYRSVVEQAWEIYECMGFDMRDAKWSPGSCYFDFRPRNYKNEFSRQIVRAQFRLSDHRSRTWSDSWEKGVLRMSFVLNGYDVSSIDEYLDRLGDIGVDLLGDDFSRLPRG